MKTVYLQKDTDIIDILEKIDDFKDKEIILAVPIEHKQFEKEITYQILKLYEKEKDKKFIISSNNLKIIELAKKYEFETKSRSERIESYVKEIFYSPKKEVKEKHKKEHKIKTSEKKNLNFIWVLVVLILIVGIIYLLGIFVVNKAEINVVLERGKKNFNYDFYIESDINKSSSDTMTLKGIFLNEIKPVVNSYPIKNTAEMETKAYGKVKIVNRGNEFTLIPNTRFVSEDGKVFRTKDKVKIPAGTEEKPTVVEVEVFAQEPGSEYNIGPSKFKIPGLAGSEIEKKIEVFSENSFTGGGKNLVKIPTLEEYNEAQREFDKDSRNYIENYIKNNFKDVTFPDEAKIISITIEKIEPQDIKNITASLDELKIYGNAKIIALGYRESDLLNMIKDLEVKMIKEGYQIDNVEIAKKELKEINLSSGKGKISVEGTIYVKPIFNETEFKKSLASKDINQVYDILKTKEGIKEAKIIVWPFWVKKIPQDINKIKVNIK